MCFRRASAGRVTELPAPRMELPARRVKPRGAAEGAAACANCASAAAKRASGAAKRAFGAGHEAAEHGRWSFRRGQASFRRGQAGFRPAAEGKRAAAEGWGRAAAGCGAGWREARVAGGTSPTVSARLRSASYRNGDPVGRTRSTSLGSSKPIGVVARGRRVHGVVCGCEHLARNVTREGDIAVSAEGTGGGCSRRSTSARPCRALRRCHLLTHVHGLLT